VLLSGLAFESGGLSIAHALTRGFSAQPAMSAYLHGEMVAFGSIVQKFAQQDSLHDICQHADLVFRFGLPVCFADFNGFDPSRKTLEDIAATTCRAPYAAHVVPSADVHGIADALDAADALGRSLRPAK
jgi:glycerol dehydrogenase